MKETIYTIPLNEAMDAHTECPFCFLHHQLEEKTVDYYLGAAMMEPNVRIVTNAKGFCHTHLTQMLNRQKSLSLALTLDTHIERVNERINRWEEEVNSLSSKKRWTAKSNADACLDKLADQLSQTIGSCAVCDDIAATMERYYDTFFYLYRTETDFKDKAEGCLGFCLPHFRELLTHAKSALSGQEKIDFIQHMYAIERENLSRINEELHYYTQKFDYRNQNADWKNAKDAPRRSVEKLVSR